MRFRRMVNRMMERGPQIVVAGHPALRTVAKPVGVKEIGSAETEKLVVR
jgi:hypothetical protein